MKTVKLFFPKDAYYNDPNVPLYNGGKTYDIPEAMATRWIKRGAIVVKEAVKLEKANPQTPTPTIDAVLPVDPSAPSKVDEDVADEIAKEDPRGKHSKKRN